MNSYNIEHLQNLNNQSVTDYNQRISYYFCPKITSHAKPRKIPINHHRQHRSLCTEIGGCHCGFDYLLLGSQQTRESGDRTPQTLQFFARNHFFFGVDV